MSKKNDNKKISYNVGDFKVLKSDINLNLKNFIGYNDDDLKIVSDFNNSNISLAVKDNVYINNCPAKKCTKAPNPTQHWLFGIYTHIHISIYIQLYMCNVYVLFYEIIKNIKNA